MHSLKILVFYERNLKLEIDRGTVVKVNDAGSNGSQFKLSKVYGSDAWSMKG